MQARIIAKFDAMRERLLNSYFHLFLIYFYYSAEAPFLFWVRVLHVSYVRTSDECIVYDVYECKKNYAEMHVLLDTLIEIEQSSNPNSVFPDRKDASSAAHFNGFVVPPFLEPTQFSLPVDNSSRFYILYV